MAVPSPLAADPFGVADSSSLFPLLQGFAAELAAAGVEHVCICPGARSTPLTAALALCGDLRAWSHVDERSAAFFALGIAKASGRPAAVLCTSGTAAANFFPAVVEAKYARVPLIVLTADRPPELRDCGAGQTIDQIKLYGDYPKWFVEVGDTEVGDRYYRNLAARAAAQSAAAPAGPVHLNFPFRDPLVPEHAHLLRRSDPAAKLPPPTVGTAPTVTRASAAAVIDLANRIASTACGLILCGPADTPAATAAAIASLAREAGYPILADTASQLRGGAHDKTLVVDSYEVLVINERFAARCTPDLVLRFGPMPTCKRLRHWLETCGTPQVVIDASGAWDDPSHTARQHWHADPMASCQDLRRALRDIGGRSDGSEWVDRWTDAARAARAAIDARVDAIDDLSGAGVFAALSRILPDGVDLYVGNSMPIRELELCWPCGDRDVRILCNRGANGIDGFLSSGLGAAAASGRPTVVVTGDLGFYHDMNGLLAIKRHRLPITIVVLNNDGGGIFSHLPQTELGALFDEFFTTPHGLDFEAAAKLYGCEYSRVESANDFHSRVERSVGSGRASIIEVPLDRSTGVTLHRSILEDAARAIG
jgi:2-succinyl-5-enolpyruvyl-6-hydroxy-3-cyclohexene-1-carboxylate synthase